MTRDRSRGLLELDQSKYTEQVLHSFGMTKCKSAPTPAPEGQTLTKLVCPVTETEKMESALVPHQSLLGKLLYFRITRPDTLQIVSKLTSCSSCWGIQHWKATKCVLRYLKGTIEHGLIFQSSGKLLTDK